MCNGVGWSCCLSIHQSAAGPRAVCSAVTSPADSPGAAVPVPPPLSLSLIVAQVVTLQALAQVRHTAELLVVVVEFVLALPLLDPLCRDSLVTHPAQGQHSPSAGTARCHLPRQQQCLHCCVRLMPSCVSVPLWHPPAPLPVADLCPMSCCPSICPSVHDVSHVHVPL